MTLANFWAGTKGFFAGVGQGVANTANGLQDLAIGALNLPGAAVNGIAWVEEQVGILDEDDPLRVPKINSPDWSRGLYTHEDGEGWADSHNWSKGAGAIGVTAGAAAWARAAKLAAEAEGAAAAARAAHARRILDMSNEARALARTAEAAGDLERAAAGYKHADELLELYFELF